MKLPILVAIAFVVGLAGGTGFGVATAPRPAGVADSTQASAGHAAKPQHDAVPASAPAHAPLPASDDTAAAPGTGVPHAAAPVSGALAALHAGSGAHPSVREVAAQARAARSPEDFRQVARILTTMKPSDAAKIMAFLGDEHVEGVIRAVGPRQAAVLMVQIPPQRAAALTKRLIDHPSPPAEKP